MRPYLERLKQIFPQGVCDFSLPDLGRPPDLLKAATEPYLRLSSEDIPDG
jgi:hypothetical protein